MGKTPYSRSPAVVSVMRAAEILAVDRETIYRSIELGQIRAVRLGRILRIPVAEIERLTAAQQPAGGQ